MKRRTFIKGLALSLLAPTMLAEALVEPRHKFISITTNTFEGSIITDFSVYGKHFDYLIIDEPYDATDLSHVKNIKEWIYGKVEHGEE